VKLIQKIKPLYTLVVGIAEAMQGMGWVVMLTVVWLYMGALCFVKLVGHGLVFGGNAPEDIKQLFPNVPSAMWVLFKVMNGDPNDLERLFQERPVFKLVIAVFMIISSWAILSILTAVVSDHMIDATAKLETNEGKEKNNDTRQSLGRMFDEGDTNNDSKLTESEFCKLIGEDEYRADEVSQAAKVDAIDMKDLFYVLSTAEASGHDGNTVSCIDKQDFVDGIMSYSEPVTHRALFRLEKRLTTVMRDEARQSKATLERMMKEISGHFKAVTEKLEKRMDGTTETVTRVVKAVSAVAEDICRIDSQVAAVVEMQSNANEERHLLRSAVDSVCDMQNQANEERQLLRTSIEGIEQMFRASTISLGDEAWEDGAISDCASLDTRLQQLESALQRIVVKTATEAKAPPRRSVSRGDFSSGQHGEALGASPRPSTPSGPPGACGRSGSPSPSGDPAASACADGTHCGAEPAHLAADAAGACATAPHGPGPRLSMLRKDAHTPSVSTADYGTSPLLSTPGDMAATASRCGDDRDGAFAADSPSSDSLPKPRFGPFGGDLRSI